MLPDLSDVTQYAQYVDDHKSKYLDDVEIDFSDKTDKSIIVIFTKHYFVRTSHHRGLVGLSAQIC